MKLINCFEQKEKEKQPVLVFFVCEKNRQFCSVQLNCE